jgi:hypothetical protein
MKRILFWLALPLLVGCSHTIKYGLNESDKWTGPKISGVVYVKGFVDAAAPITNKVEHVGKQVWRTNYRKGYASTNLSSQVTAMIAKHLAYSGLFTGVSSNEVNAKFVLSGTLTDFQTHGSANETAEGIQAVSAGFGALGAILGAASTSGMKSEIKTAVALSDVQLADKSGQAIWHDSISVTNDVRISFEEATQNAIFNQPDKGLHEAVNEMIRRMGNSALTNRTEAKP